MLSTVPAISFRCLYADHPLRDDIAGTVESIAELTPQMLYNCTKAFYAPSNMVLRDVYKRQDDVA